MAITVGDKTYRNLPEQVEENANNIEWLKQTISEFGNVMRYCGSVATYADLPADDNRVGDVYNVLDTGNNYAWDGEAWDEISSIVDLTGYVQKACIAPEYDETATYVIGNICFHEDKLYKCTTGIYTPEVWTAAHWTEIKIGTDFVNTFGSQSIGGIKNFTAGTVRFGDIYREIVSNSDSLIIKNNKSLGDVQIIADTANYVFDDAALYTMEGTELGTSSYQWTNLYLSNAIYFGSSGIISYRNSSFAVSSHFTPYVTSNYDLGASSYTWRNLYLSGNIDFGDGAKIYKDSSNRVCIQYSSSDKIKVASANTIIANRIDPDSDNSQDIGRDTVRWKDLYLSGVLSDGTNSLSVLNLKRNQRKTLADTYYGSITTSAISTGWYKNSISITSGGYSDTPPIEVWVMMSDGSSYPAVVKNGGLLLEIFCDVDFTANSLTVLNVVYRGLF